MEDQIRRILSNLSLGELRYFDRIGSTNDEALKWAESGAGDGSLVFANEQTSGRGRMGRSWITPQDTALALSLILRPTQAELDYPSRTTGMLALALVDCLQALGLSPSIKWPNDVLVNGKKLAGILVESRWNGAVMDALVLGIGINVAPASIPPADQLLFPATSIEVELSRPISRVTLLGDLLTRFLAWRPNIDSSDFLQAWENLLAYRGELVKIKTSNGRGELGILVGLDRHGGLRLEDEHGRTVTVEFGDVHLRSAA